MDWSVLGENAGLLAQGLLVTLEVSVSALVLALALGLIVATLRVAPSQPLRAIAAAYVEFLRNIPLLVQLFFLFFALPSVGIRLPAFVCGVLALGVYTSAFVAEAIRSGISAVPKGQLEAGLSSGMRYVTVMRTIVLPQAVAKTIPPLGNTALNLIKNSSLVSTVSVLDILGTANLIGARTFQYVPMFVGAAICYLILTLPAAFAVNRLEKRYAR
jgi:aspartate/glutamate/glutamine transport system permease protein